MKPKNQNWGKKMIDAPVQPTRWALMLMQAGITEEQAAYHPLARAWARAHYHRCYIPENLLKLWGFNALT